MMVEKQLAQFISDEEIDHNEVESETDYGEISPTLTDYVELDPGPVEDREFATSSTSAAKENKQKGHKRDIAEDRLNTTSSTLMAMKELMEKSGMLNMINSSKYDEQVEESSGKEKGNECHKNSLANQSTSKTAIYQCALQKDHSENNTMNKQEKLEIMEVDSEVTFKINPQTEEVEHKQQHSFSSSSDEQVDTSDEMIELEINVSEKFIADCAKQAAANKRKRCLPEELNEELDNHPRNLTYQLCNIQQWLMSNTWLSDPILTRHYKKKLLKVNMWIL